MIRKLLILTLLVSLVNCSNKKKDNSNQNLLLLLALNSQQKKQPGIDPTSISATEITLNSTTSTSGTISSSDIYYKATLVSGKASLFGVFGLSTSLNLQITAYDTAGNYAGAINKNSEGTLEQISIGKSASGVYYFGLTSVSGSGNFRVQIFNGPVSGNGICDITNSCIDNAAGSTFTSANCTGGNYSPSTASPSTCSGKVPLFGGTIIAKCTTFSNNGAQTLNRLNGYGTFTESDCASAVKGEAYLFE